MRPLTEAHYSLPGNGATAMFDFYCLYAMWFELGGGHDEYGYSGRVAPKIVNDRRAKVIDELFRSCTHQLSRAIIKAGEYLVYDEAEHAVDASLVPVHAFEAWVDNEADGTTRRLMQSHRDQMSGEYIMPLPQLWWSKVGWPGAVRWFEAGFWAEHAWAYGGAKWATITLSIMELLQSIKHDHQLLVVVNRIDHIYDLEHNSGLFFDKRGHALQVSKEDLDIRAGAKPRDFSGRVSPVVQRVLDSSLPHLTDSTYQEMRERVSQLLEAA